MQITDLYNRPWIYCTILYGVFKYLSILYTIFHSGHNIMNFYEQCVRGPGSLCSSILSGGCITKTITSVSL